MLRLRTGLSMREVAEALGWTLTRYQHYEDRYRRNTLPMDFVNQLADLFVRRGIPLEDVTDLAGVPRKSVPNEPITQPPPPPPPAMPRDLPIMGTVKGGAGGVYINEGEAKEYIVRPPSLASVSNAFALYVHGESMEPRYYAGEVLYVNPNRPLTKGCFVAVEMNDGEALIKQFVRSSDDLLVLVQFNPPKEIRLPITGVKSVYRITGSGEFS